MGTDDEIAASLVGRTILEATFEDEGNAWSGCSHLTLKLDDGREIDVVSSGWHDISSLSLTVA